jgi:hypothetical protein
MSENSSRIDRYIKAANDFADYVVAENDAEKAAEYSAEENTEDNSTIKNL